MIWVLPLEPLPERYTQQWWNWFVDAFTRRDVDYRMIDGQPLTKSVETGLVLDAAGTNFWKFRQLMRICAWFKEGYIHDGDKFFTMDLWHPGLEAIPYMAHLYGIKVHIYGFLHAGSYTIEDFAEPMAPWAHYFERGWFDICDRIFVGSKYHADEVILKRQPNPYHVVVTGNPFNSTEILKAVKNIKPVHQRDNIVIFPHRWDKEKHPEIFIELMNQVYDNVDFRFRVIISTGRQQLRDPGYLRNAKFPVTIRYGLSKEEYYNVLAEARIMVSTAVDEHFGYCTAEAAVCGCAIVAPNKWSYPELLKNDTRFLYDTLEGAVRKIESYLINPVSVPLSYMQIYDQSVDRIIDEIA